MKTVLLAAAVLLSASVAYAADATIQADKDAILTNCSTDAQTAGCGTEKVGTGLLKCLHAYKKANAGYKFAPTCKTAMMQLKADKSSEGKK